jgi:hypothetical protein
MPHITLSSVRFALVRTHREERTFIKIILKVNMTLIKTSCNVFSAFSLEPTKYSLVLSMHSI